MRTIGEIINERIKELEGRLDHQRWTEQYIKECCGQIFEAKFLLEIIRQEGYDV